jgi:uncharacterized protein (TIGR02453 family)
MDVPFAFSVSPLAQPPVRSQVAAMSVTTTEFEGFRPAALRFLRGLARNNNKGWFEPRREEYETEVRQPLRDLLEAVDIRLAKVAPELTADLSRSIFRVYRDIRFSRDKSPYKTHASFWVNHRRVGRADGTRVHGGAGIYFHIQPGASLVAAGIWMPSRPALTRIRAAISEDARGFQAVLRKVPKRWGHLNEESMLQRLPRGYATTDPAAPWLRYQSFTVSHPVAATDLRRPTLPNILAHEYAGVIPLVRWLNTALGYPPDKSR